MLSQVYYQIEVLQDVLNLAIDPVTDCFDTLGLVLLDLACSFFSFRPSESGCRRRTT